jgi:hypothetical protein
MIEKGSIVRLRAPKHRDTLEDPEYCKLWEAATPMIVLGNKSAGHMWIEVMAPCGEVRTFWRNYLTTRMRRGYYGV